jgi:uncharacterized repeat protein (TIGR03943 family)
MGTWLVLSGVVAVALGVVLATIAWLATRRRAGEPPLVATDHGSSRVGWLLLLPILVAVIIDPGALGSYAVGQQAAYRAPAISHIDVEAMLRSRSFGGQAAEVSLLELWQAVEQGASSDSLAGTPLSLDGFMIHDENIGQGFVLARLVVGCCAGDALPVAVMVRGDPQAEIPDDTWVRVQVRFDPDATQAARDEPGEWALVAAVVDLVELEVIDPPDEPYLYPY